MSTPQTAVTPQQQAEMLAAAREAATLAYAPYSKFHVGAAVLDEQGRIFSGCNVENISFGLTVCAERNAVGMAIRAGAKSLKAVLVYTPTAKTTSPCGACRQVLAEFGPGMQVFMHCDGAEPVASTLDLLMPATFTDLQQN